MILRDTSCVFPGCTVDARRCDLDHIRPYDDAGPPGQTRPDNLAPLCRRHHRAKTHGRWHYERVDTGDYAWTSPSGRAYVVAHPS
ncbi:MAG: HNH endonuclease [Nocardioidaceae bacterium]|nr:HNH endonuclease [Nocardioidaceae bacterium]NUS50202.1 HNH endonuclease [Nocardioidaceae bacterium]